MVRKCRRFVCKKRRERRKRERKEFYKRLLSIPVIHFNAILEELRLGAQSVGKWFWPHMPKGEPRFKSLAPTENAERIDIYKEALSQALQDKSVLNIAVAGVYGSGKSSFLRTYFKENPSFWPFGAKKNKVISISLADLAIRSGEKQRDGNGNENPITRQEVELSILHQLFFHEQAGSLADSQFTKIQKIGKGELVFYTICLIVYILSCIHLIWPGYWTSTLRLEELPWNISMYRTIWHWLAVAVVLVVSGWILSKLVRVIMQLVVRSLSVNSANIEIASKREKSILNAHIDEIIYFFSVTGYNVVLLEDLDRFKQQNIFVKLREINYLINNSEEVKQPVHFIYALRDEMFQGGERTKFFDFIIPIIPRVDISNAGDMMHNLVPSYLADVVDAVAIYLNDTRMLNNIANEFNIYKNQQFRKDDKVDDQLLALIVYKNLYPEDFEQLRTENAGLLAHALKSRSRLVESGTKTYDAKIAEIEEQIKKAGTEYTRDARELRMLIMAEVLKQAMDHSGGSIMYRSIICDGQAFGITELANEDKFKLLKNARTYAISDNNGYRTFNGTPFNEMAKNVYGEMSYDERLKLVNIKADDTEARNEIQELEEKKLKLKSKTLQQLIQTKELKIDWGSYEKADNEKQRELVIDMLRGGYITEDYADYISFFHPGSMHVDDYRFIRSVRGKESMPPDSRVYNTRRIIEKLNPLCFLQSEILNYFVVDTLVANFTSNEKYANFIRQIKEYSDTSLGFLASYVGQKGNARLLVCRLCADKDNLLWDAARNSKLSDSEKLSIAKGIVAFADKEDVIENFKSNSEYLSAQADFFIWNEDRERLQFVAKELGLKFYALVTGTSEEDERFVYANNLYAINPELFRRLLPEEIAQDERYNISNYTLLRSTDQEGMLAYIESNMRDYVQYVLLNLPTNTQEEPEYESRLLVSDKLTDSLREELIRRGGIQWEAVDRWDKHSKEVELMLYRNNRVEVTWENVLYLYGLDEDTFVQYIQQENVLRALKELGTPDFEGNIKEKWEEMQNAIVANPNLETVVKQLVDCFTIAFEQVTIMNCSEKLLRLLIEKGRIARGVHEYEVLHGVNPDMALRFFVKHYESYKAVIPDLKFNEHDVDQLFLEEYDLSVEQKLRILECIEADKSVTEYNANDLINFLMQPDVYADTEKDGIFNVIDMLLCLENVPTLTRIILFNKYPIYDEEGFDELDYMIDTFETAYISDGRLRHQIPYSPEAYKFGRYLMKIGYIKNCVKFVQKGIISITKK